MNNITLFHVNYLSVEKEDELKCLIKGCNFLMCNVPNEVYTIDYQSSKYEFQVIENDKIFPYLLVNIGSGVSILKVISLVSLFLLVSNFSNSIRLIQRKVFNE